MQAASICNSFSMDLPMFPAATLTDLMIAENWLSYQQFHHSRHSLCWTHLPWRKNSRRLGTERMVNRERMSIRKGIPTVGNIYRQLCLCAPEMSAFNFLLNHFWEENKMGIGVLQRAPDSGWPWLRPFGRAQVCKVRIYNLTHLQNRPRYFYTCIHFKWIALLCFGCFFKTLGNPTKNRHL